MRVVERAWIVSVNMASKLQIYGNNTNYSRILIDKI